MFLVVHQVKKYSRNFAYYILYGTLPALDAYNRPKWAYGLRIHDLCERRGHFDAGEFVEEFGDEGAKRVLFI